MIIEEPDQTPDEPEATEPEATEPEAPAEEPQAEEPQAEEPAPAEEPAAEEAAPAEEEAPAEEPVAEPAAAEPVADEPAAEQAAEPEPAAPPAEKGPPAAAAEKPKAKDQAPGADLEPINLEPERELSAEERARLEAEEEERARLEREAEAGDEPLARSPQVEIAPDARVQATGKRKSSIARVILRAGSGDCQINGKPLDEYFPRQALRTMARSPLLTAGYESSVDVQVRVHGGGIAGQAGAVRHGIARALTDIDPELRSELKRRGLLTRDARKKERRKAGLKKARKKPQFSKR